MRRRTFLQIPAAAALAQSQDLPQYRVVSSYKAWPRPGMPGPYPGRVVSLKSPKVIDPSSEKVDAAIVAEMFRRGLTSLTGDKDVREAWRRFISPSDVVGIKVNCSGAPGICSHPVVVTEIVRSVIGAGVPVKNIWIYERFPDQMQTVKYENYVPEGVHVYGVSRSRTSSEGYDPRTYVEVNFFGEEETRSNMVRVVSETCTKLINVPNMKDHGASGVTGCLKNIAYGNFHNVARSHDKAKTHTLSLIGTLASVEPVRSRTVLQVVDGLKAVWHGGPFSPTKKFRFYPGQIMFGTDPVAIDRLIVDIVDDKRKAEGAISVWDRSEKYLASRPGRALREDPNVNNYIREPGHIEFATRFGLGVYDKAKIKLEEIAL